MTRDQNEQSEFRKYLMCGRIEQEAQRNVELMWLTDRLMPDHKTISDFRKDNSKTIRGVCRSLSSCAGV